MNPVPDLENQLHQIPGSWNHYRLRLWQGCRSAQAAGVEDRIRIAEEVLSNSHRGEWIWALGGWHMLLGEVTAKLDDSDPHVRQDTVVALVDFGTHARGAVPILLDRVSSRETALHDRTLAAWALPRIGAGESAVPILLQVIEESDQPEVGELRFRAAEAVESLTDSFRVLVPLARRLVGDRHWKCRLHGVRLIGRLVWRERRLLAMIAADVERLVDDEVEVVREGAGRVVRSTSPPPQTGTGK